MKYDLLKILLLAGFGLSLNTKMAWAQLEGEIRGKLSGENSVLEDGYYLNIHQINGNAGQTMKIDLISDEFDPFLSLKNSNGQVLISDNDGGDSGNSKIAFILPDDGLYTLEVRSANFHTMGEYKLHWQPLETTIDFQLFTAADFDDQSKKLSQEGDYDRAIYMTKLAIGFRQSAAGENNPEVATRLHNLALLYQRQGKYQQAEVVHQQALEMRRAVFGEEHTSITLSLGHIATLFHIQEEYAKAESYYQQAIEMFEKIPGAEYPHVFTIFTNLAKLYEYQGRYQETETTYQQATTIVKNIFGDEHSAVLASLNSLASLYLFQGKYAESEDYYLQAFDIAKKISKKEYPDVSNSLSNLALVYESQGRYEESEDYYLQAIAIIQNTFDVEHIDIATNLNNLGEVYRKQGMYEKAISSYLQAITIVKNILGESHPKEAISLNNLALIYQAQGKYVDAEFNYLKAQKILRANQREYHPDFASYTNNLAILYTSQKKYKDAESYYLQSLSMLEEFYGGSHPYLASTLVNMAVLYWTQDEIVESFDYLQRGLATQENILAHNILAGDDFQKRQFIQQFSSALSDSISFDLAYSALHSATTNSSLKTIFHRKGRLLNIANDNYQQLRQNLDSTDQILLDDLRQIHTELANQFHRSPEEFDRQRADQLAAKAKTLEAELSQRNREFAIQQQPVTISDVRAKLPANSTLIEFIRYKPFDPKAPQFPVDERWGEEHYAAYLLPKVGEPIGIDLGDAATIETKIKTLRNFQQNPRTDIDKVKVAARELDELIFEPLRPHLSSDQHLLLSPDAALHTIPFETLVDSNGKYLLETNSISYLTSGRDLLRLDLHEPSENYAMIYGDPIYDKDGQFLATNSTENSKNLTRSLDLQNRIFARLIGTKKEAEAIVETIGSQYSTQLFLNQSATEASLKENPRPSLLHIATHGFFEENRSEETFDISNRNPLLLSGLALAGVKVGNSGNTDEDGILTALEVLNLDLRGTQLVVLSACDTGRGDIAAGEGVYGLRRAFAIAGAESQLISLWKVDDTATQELMTAYYQRLMNGESRQEALRQTQLAMLKDPNREHPFFWSAFIFSGNWKPLPNAS